MTTPLKRILVVDDDEGVRVALKSGLSNYGFEVETANDGEEALDALSSQTFDLLLTDAIMPNMDGMTLAHRVGDLYPGLPVILMTGHTQEGQKAKDFVHIINQVIAKPFDLSQICRVTDEVLRDITARAPTNDNEDY